MIEFDLPEDLEEIGREEFEANRRMDVLEILEERRRAMIDFD